MRRSTWIAIIAAVLLVDAAGVVVAVKLGRRALRTLAPTVAALPDDPNTKPAPVTPRGQRLVDLMKAKKVAKEPVRTENDFGAILTAWNKRTLLEAYKEQGQRSPKWDKQVLTALEAMVEYWSDPNQRCSSRPLVDAARPLADTECRDPLVQHTIGLALHLDGKPADAEAHYRLAVEGYSKSEYSRGQAWGAALGLAQVCEALGGSKREQAQKWADLCVKWAIEAAREPCKAEGEQRALWLYLSALIAKVSEPMRSSLSEGLIKDEKADLWISRMAEGSYHIDKAWAARGSGWADEVDTKGWKGFEDHLKAAREALVEAWNLHPEFPEAAAAMVTVTMGGETEGGVSARDWFNRAAEAQIDWDQAYRAYLTSLLPRWGGTHDAMYDLGVECVETGLYDVALPEYLLWILGLMEQEDGAQYWTRPGVYDELKVMFEGIQAEPAQVKRHLKMKTVWAVAAWRCGQYAEARRLLDELGDKAVTRAATDYFHTPFEQVKKEVHDKTGGAGGKAS